MQQNLVDDEEGLARIVREARTVAVVGMKDGSGDAHEPAFTVPRALQARGLTIIPVNPKLQEALGLKAYPSLTAVPEPFDVVDVFRASDKIPQLADEILALPAARRPRVVWMQTGIRHPEAAARLAAAGIQVVQNHCMKVFSERYRDPTYPTV